MSNCTLELEIDPQTEISGYCPTESDIKTWLLSFVGQHRPETILTITLVSAERIQQLNAQYRQKDKPTNILSFAAQLPPGVPYPFLGDLVICPSIVVLEAQTQNKPIMSHWAHLLIHGTLHLLGYDHENESDAIEMENYEVKILSNLGFDNPYGDTNER